MTKFYTLLVGDRFTCPAISHLTKSVLTKDAFDYAVDENGKVFMICLDWNVIKHEEQNE